MKIRTSITQTFSLNKDIIKKFDDLKWQTKKNQSELLRSLLNHIFDNYSEEELKKIIRKNLN